jgi:hypothetical protein
MENPAIEAIQACLILTFLSTSYGKFSVAWNMLGIALRMAYFLRFNEDPDDLAECRHSSWVERETRRRCWWVAKVIDGNISTMTSRPRMIKGGSCIVKGVCPNIAWYQPSEPEPIITDQERESSPANYVAQLVDLVCDIMVYSRGISSSYKPDREVDPFVHHFETAYATSGSLTTNDDELFVVLNAKLSSWATKAPSGLSLKPTKSEIRQIVSSLYTGYDNLQYLHAILLYNQSICMLNYNRVLKMATTIAKDPTSDLSSLRNYWKSLSAVEDSALSISVVMRAIYKEKVPRPCGGPILFCAFQSSLILLLLQTELGRMCLSKHPNPPSTATEERLLNFRKGIFYNVESLKSISKDWMSARTMLDMLRKTIPSIDYLNVSQLIPLEPPGGSVNLMKQL